MSSISAKTTTDDVKANVKRAFPGAIENAVLARKVSYTLSAQGFGKNNTQLATSFCCDEVNRELDDELRAMYGFNFNMGGLAGFPFGGVTSFGAMSHHIPNGGSCLVVYGPHVGVDADGNVGKINRKGRTGNGACCGSAAAAAAYVKGVTNGTSKAAPGPEEPTDAQQTWVGSALLPHGERLINAEDEAVELPNALFEGIDEMMKKIVDAGCGEVAGKGLIALLGGIQINTPGENADYFLVKEFQIRNNKGEVVKTKEDLDEWWGESTN